MFLYLELWNVRPAWLALAHDEREAFMARAGATVGELLAEGIEIVGWGMNEPTTVARAPYDFFAVWRMPSAELMDRFAQTVDALNWRTYFEQVDLRGALVMPDAVIAQHLAAS
jgi:hypothetical protein